MDIFSIFNTLIDKMLFVIFFMACLLVIRQIFLFIRHLNNPEPTPYSIDKKSLFYLGLSVALIIASLLRGIGL